MKYKRSTVLKGLFVGAMACLAFGYIAPAALLSDNVDDYQGTERKIAENALQDLESALSSPSTYKLVTTKLRVVSVEYDASVCGDYTTIIRFYTYFGIPTDLEYIVDACGGSTSYTD